LSKVIPFTGITRLDLSPDIVLENLKGKLEGFVLVGYTTDGEEFFSSTYADGGTALWLMERGKTALLSQEISNDETI
jgi:hypothetical protein